MTRKKFIQSHGATCQNWYWSWSFVNEKKRIVIFGEWDRHKINNDKTMILGEDWENSRGRTQPGYGQAREHIRLVEEKGYTLMTYPMEYSDRNKKKGVGPWAIGKFTPILTRRKLLHVGSEWFATSDNTVPYIPEEIEPKGKFFEGALVTIQVNSYERNSKARKACLKYHGYSCKVCDFNFVKVYGAIGRNYIHVHHILPLSQLRERYKVDPIKDLIPVCPNCHAMLHNAEPVLAINELKRIMKKIIIKK